ncbi:myosin-8 [Drosophila obscura]|uniref:myosin-8 n=1 Tax=Drosophila obscura TaxID=7282 RepID=UPI001BB19847|nr:myosin-8 [Drosophila obscura]
MVNRTKASRSLGEGDAKEKDQDQVYCVVLHVVEAINFIGRDGERETIVMNAALNTVDFEVEGTPSATAETIIFNSNCIWECDMAGIKRIKTDHRPVKLTFFACSKHLQRKPIGTVLLPVRGLPVLTSTSNTTPLQLKMFWHKLICISPEFRSHKPEVLLMLAIIKKSILHNKDFEHLLQVSHIKQPPTPPLKSPGHSITASMLQSQANVYVQSLVQLGLLQVGNDPLIDCDIIEVVLQFKKLKNLAKLVKSLSNGKEPAKSITLVFDFVGNVTNIELKTNDSDAYMLTDVLGLRFKSSLHSMRLYFQRIFYLPINMYVNGTAIANYRMDFGKLLPADSYFAENRKFVRNGCLTFNRFGRMDSSRDIKPQMEYSFSVELKAIYSRPTNALEESEQYRPAAPFVFTKEQQPSDSKDPTPDNGSLNVAATEEVLDVRANAEGDPVCVGKDFRRRKKSTSLTCQPECGQDSEEGLVRKLSSTIARKPIESNDKPKRISNSLFQYSNDCNAPAAAAECLAIYSNQKFDYDVSKDESSEGPKEELMVDGKEKVEASPNNVERIESQQVPAKRPKMKSEADKNPSRAAETEVSMEQLTKLLGQEVEKLTKSVEIIENRSQQSQHRKSRKMEIDLDEDPFESDSTLCSIRRKHLRKSSKTEQRSATSINLSHTKETKERIRHSSGQKRVVEESRVDETDASMESAWPEDYPAPRENLKRTYKVKVKHSDIDINSLTECEVFKVQRGKRKSKSEMRLPKQPESSTEQVSGKPTKAKRKGKMSMTELSLRARWVEVNKVQAQALNETEKFLEQTCQSELREEQQTLEQPKLVESKKNITKVRSSKVRIQRDSDAEDNLHAGNARENNAALPVESAESSVSFVGSESSSLHVISSQSSEKRIKRIIKKMRVSKTTIQEENVAPGTFNVLPEKLVKKKSSGKIPVEVVESSEQFEEPVQSQHKKKVKKKRSKPVMQQQSEDDDDVTSMETVVERKSSKKSVRESSSRKSLERTSYVSALDQFFSPENVGDTLKAWRQQQIQLFEAELERKEQQYKNDLQQMEYQELNKHITLDETLARNQAIDAYEAKFKELQQHINQLQTEIDEQVRLFASRSQEMRQENKQLEMEKTKLKERIFHLETQMHELRGQGKGSDDRDLNHILKEMRSQNDRFVELSKEKERYKKQWRRSAKQVHDLKLAMHEKSAQMDEGPFNLRQILTKDMQEFEEEFGHLRHTNGVTSFSVSSLTGSGDSSSNL